MDSASAAMTRPSPPPLPTLGGGRLHRRATPRLHNPTGSGKTIPLVPGDLGSSGLSAYAGVRLARESFLLQTPHRVGGTSLESVLFTVLGKLRVLTIRATHSGLRDVSVQSPPDDEVSVTGAAYSFKGATTSLTNRNLTSSKKITLVRHGLSSWNAESRVQGSSNLSVLTETGVKQAEKCRDALANMKFDVCFSSPISRAKSTAEIIWQGKEEPLVFLDSLKEAHLFFLEGMTNADAKKQYPELYNKWREDPSNFHVNGIYPLKELWGTARQAWEEILLTPGENFLVVTHKSILRALICTALGLPPERFRVIDVNNGGMCVFTVNKRGEAMLQALNMTAHIYSDHTYQF